MYKTLKKKKIAVKKIQKFFENGNLNIIINNQNINSEKNTLLRNACNKLGATVFLLKNSIAKLALQSIDNNIKLNDFFQEQNLLISTPENETKIAKLLTTNIYFPIKNIKKAYWNGKILNANDIIILSKLNTKKDELKTLIKLTNYSLYHLHKIIQYPINHFFQILKNLKKKQ